jgi:hypothetical protein
MASIGTMAVHLALDAEHFFSGMKQVASTLENFASKVGGIGPLGALAGGLSIGGVLSELDKGMDRILEMKKIADRLGVSMQSASVFQRMIGDNEKFAQGLNRIAKEFGAVEAGSDAAVKKFAALGIDAKALVGIPFDEKFKVLAEHISKLPTAEQRIKAATDIAGRGGADMVDKLAKGPELFNRMAEQAEHAGTAVSRAQAETVKLVKNMEKLHQLEREGSVNQLSAFFAQTERNILEYTAREGSAFDPGGVEAKKKLALLKGIEAKQELETPEFLAMQEKTQKFNEAAEKLNETLDIQSQMIGQNAHMHEVLKLEKLAVTDADRAMVQGFKDRSSHTAFSTALQQVHKNLEVAKKSLFEGAHAQEVLKIAALATTAAEREQLEQELTGARAMDENSRRKQHEAKLYEEGQRAMESSLTPMQKFREEMEKLQELEEAGEINRETQERLQVSAFEKLKREAGRSTEGTAGAAATFGSAADVAARAHAMNAGAGTTSVQDIMRRLEEVEKQKLANGQMILAQLKAMEEKGVTLAPLDLDSTN